MKLHEVTFLKSWRRDQFSSTSPVTSQLFVNKTRFLRLILMACNPCILQLPEGLFTPELVMNFPDQKPDRIYFKWFVVGKMLQIVWTHVETWSSLWCFHLNNSFHNTKWKTYENLIPIVFPIVFIFPTVPSSLKKRSEARGLLSPLVVRWGWSSSTWRVTHGSIKGSILYQKWWN